MKVSGEKTYALAVRDGGCLFVFLWVKRSVKRSGASEFFAFLPRPHDPCIDAHASYHVDGRFHWKTHEQYGAPKFNCTLKQKPDQNFRGTRHLLSHKIAPRDPRNIGKKCDPNEYSEVFEIPISELRTGKVITRVSADLVSPDHSPNLGPDIRVIRQREYQDAFPFIVLTLYEVDVSWACPAGT